MTAHRGTALPQARSATPDPGSQGRSGPDRALSAVSAGGIDAAAAGAVLTVDLGALTANYRLLRDMAGGECGAVVKADAYGIGMGPVAAALHAEGCRHFFVGHLSEGVALRAALPDAAIYVLNGVPPGAECDAAAAGLIPALNSPEQIAAWKTTARSLGRRLPGALQFDTGMTRLGLSPAAVEAVAADGETLDGIDLRLALSHLACADEPQHPANAAQAALFARLAARFPGVPRSLANSSGIFLGAAFRSDVARAGAALYGINPTPRAGNPMRAVVGVRAKVIQTADCAAGVGIGYGHDFHAHRPMRLATISLGYADGWPRRARGAAFHRGVRLPFVGRVSMDSIVLDVSALPAGTLHPGDLVEVIGDDQTVDDVAALAGTIGYEILTGLGNRFHRRWIG
ncbi:alanine racemase [Rhizobiaceae bacterium]|nr:alanine racemase [Rhizobiaceae bacterium]